MTTKFTIRDFFVYSFVGLTASILIYLYETTQVISIIKSLKEFSDFATIIFVPIFYLFGHVVMGVDDILFNLILDYPLRKRNYKDYNKFWKIYNYIFFGYRNQGLKREIQIDEGDFLKACDELIKDNNYDKPEYYQVMSDLFKGIFLCLLVFLSINLFNSFNSEARLWEVVLTIIVWYRARVFSSYYVRIISRSIQSHQ